MVSDKVVHTSCSWKSPSQTALDNCFLYRDTVLLRELNAAYTQLAPCNLCVKVLLFIQCALYPISSLTKTKKKWERDSPWISGLRSVNTPGLCSSVFKSLETTGRSQTDIRCFIQLTDSAPQRFSQRVASYSNGYSLFLFLSMWGCSKGRGQRCVSSCRDPENHKDTRWNTLKQRCLTNDNHKTRCFQSQNQCRCGLLSGDPSTWPGS